MRALRFLGIGTTIVLLGACSGDEGAGDGGGGVDASGGRDSDNSTLGSGGSQSSDGTGSTGSGSTGSGSTGSGDGTGGDGSGGDATGTGGSGTGGTDTGAVCDNSHPAFSCPATWPDANETLEAEVLVIANQYRAAGANCGGTDMPSVGDLSMDATLSCAARAHSADMADRDFFDHVTLDEDACECSDSDDCDGLVCGNADDDDSTPNVCGKGPGQRLKDVGSSGYTTWGENISMGRTSAEAVMTGWMASSGHCKNIMNGNYTKIGIGVAYDGGSPYWTQVFTN